MSKDKVDKRIGSKALEKFKTPEERQMAYQAFCKHIASGLSAKAFHTPCVENTVRSMLENYPDELDLDDLDIAKAKGIAIWEKMGMLGTNGKIKNFNSGSWIFNMQ